MAEKQNKQNDKKVTPRSEDFAAWYNDICLRAELAPATLARLTEAELGYIVGAVRMHFSLALIDYGSAVGILAVQAVSEPLTQYMLDSHHRSVQGGTNKSGLVRVQEIYGARGVEAEQSPAMLLPLRRELAGGIGEAKLPRPLPRGGRIAAFGIVATALALGAASALGLDLGAPTFACGVLVAVAAVVAERRGVAKLLGGVSWSVLPLVAGLFVLVAGLERTGLTSLIAGALRDLTADSATTAAGVAGLATAFGSNLVNNLPMGLFAASAAAAAGAPALVKAGLVVGVDLGPNLSVTGSLATILWLVAIRRDGAHVGGWRFLKLGLVVMPPALLLALASLWI